MCKGVASPSRKLAKDLRNGHLGEDADEKIEHVKKLDLPGYGCRWFRVSGGRWKLP